MLGVKVEKCAAGNRSAEGAVEGEHLFPGQVADKRRYLCAFLIKRQLHRVDFRSNGMEPAMCGGNRSLVLVDGGF